MYVRGSFKHEETIGTLRHENTAVEDEIRRLCTPQGIIPHTSTATLDVNVTETRSTDFLSLTAEVQALINHPATFTMAVKRNLPDTKRNDSDKSKPTTLREQVRSYQPKLRTSGVVPLCFSSSRGLIGALRRSLGTALLLGSMINLSFIGCEMLRYCARFSTRKRSSTQ